jgi:hypothetical protein
MRLDRILFLIALLLFAPAAAALDLPEVPTSEPSAGIGDAGVRPPASRPRDPFLPPAPAGKTDPFAGEATSKSPGTDPWVGPKNVVWLNALGAGDGNYAIEYQRAIHPRLALVVSPSVRMLSREIIPGRDLTITGLNLQAGLALYVPWQAPRGINLSLTGGFVRLEGKDQFTRSDTTWSVKATVGYRHDFPFGLTLELNLGYFHMPEVTLMLSHETLAYVNGGPVVELGLGWAF